MTCEQNQGWALPVLDDRSARGEVDVEDYRARRDPPRRNE